MNNYNQRLEIIEEALSEFFNKVNINKKPSITLLEAIEGYFSPEMNPNDNYETNCALNEGERGYAEGLGYNWNDWNQVKRLYNDYQHLTFKYSELETYLKSNYPYVWEDIKENL